MKKSRESILVTGCAGFIGSNFVKQFKEKFPQRNIIGIDDFSSGKKESLDKTIIFYEGSITNETLLEKIFQKHKPDYIFHFAAIPRVSYSVEQPVETTEINIIGSIQLLEKAKKYKIKKFILSSSSSIYGGAKKLPTKESENYPDPKSPYAMQKLADEYLCKIYSDLFNLETVCLRYFNVFGPGQYGDSAYSTVISAWLESLYFPKNKKAFIEGNGKKSRDFCYVDNVVKANICAMETKNKISGDFFNIGEGQRTSLIQVKKLLEKHLNKKLELEKRPDRLGDVKHTHADISKAKKVLGYKPIKNFEEGLIETIKWFEERSRENEEKNR